MYNLIFPFSVSVLINFLLFGKMLNFSLSGDDWLVLYRYITGYEGLLSFFDVRRYMGNYDVANIIMGVVYEFFGVNPKPYFILAIIFRSLSTFSIYLVIKEILKKNNYAFLGLIIHGVSYPGIQSLDWVFNMSSYLSIFFINLFFVFWIREYRIKKNKRGVFLLSVLLLNFSFIATPNRMHGIVFLIPLIELLRFLGKRRASETVIRIAIYLTPFLLFRKFTGSNWDSTYINYSKELFKEPNWEKTYTLLINLYSAVFPDTFIEKYLPYYKFNPILIKTIIIVLTLIGLSLLLIKNFNKSKNVNRIALVSLFGILFFELAPWLIYPNSTFPSSDRYHVISINYFIISLIMLISGIRNTTIKNAFLGFLVLYSIMNVWSVNTYISYMQSNGRNQTQVDYIFNYVLDLACPPSSNGLTLFLFESDNPQFLYNAVTFGFTPHIMVLCQSYLDNKETAPLAVENEDSLDKIIHGDKKELARYGYSDADTETLRVLVLNISKKNI